MTRVLILRRMWTVHKGDYDKAQHLSGHILWAKLRGFKKNDAKHEDEH